MADSKKDDLPPDNRAAEKRFEDVVRHMLNTPPYHRKKQKKRNRKGKKLK